MTVEPTPAPQVTWPAVLLGMAVAIIAGAFLVLLGWVVGMVTSDFTGTFLGATLAVLTPALIFGVTYLLVRKRFPDFARGFLIGAAVVVIVGGACNAIFVASVASGWH